VRLVHKGCSAVALPQILRKIQQISECKISIAGIGIVLKEYELNLLNWNPYDWLLSAAEREPAGPCPDVVPCVNAANASVGKTGIEAANIAAHRSFNGGLRLSVYLRL